MIYVGPSNLVFSEIQCDDKLRIIMTSHHHHGCLHSPAVLLFVEQLANANMAEKIKAPNIYICIYKNKCKFQTCSTQSHPVCQRPGQLPSFRDEYTEITLLATFADDWSSDKCIRGTTIQTCKRIRRIQQWNH